MKLEDFLPHLLTELPGCPDALVQQQLLFATIEFCTETHAWVEIQEPVRLIDAQNEIEVEVPRDTRIVAVKDIWASSRKLRPVTMDQLFERIPNWQTAESSEPVYYNAAVDYRNIRIYPIPKDSQGRTITMRVAYAPTMTSTTVPDELGIKYWDYLQAGAKGRLMLIPGKSWTNPAMAGVYKQQFEDGKLKAKIDILHDRVQGSVSVRPHPFA